MLPSEAMLRGFEMAGGRQCKNRLCRGNPVKPTAVCALGAMNLAMTGDSRNCSQIDAGSDAFFDATGELISSANDAGMYIPDIAGILASEGY